MMPFLVTVTVVVLTFLFADSILTPLLLLLWKKTWLLLLKLQALATKKNFIQAFVQSLLLAGKALLRLLNKTVTAWILPLLLTRRQRYWLHHLMRDTRARLKRRGLRLWIGWRARPLWWKALTLVPTVLLALAVFVGSGLLLAGLFGVTFIIPWIGGLPLAFIVLFRKSLARLSLFVLERLGVGPLVNKVMDWLIDTVWWQTPEPVQRRFDAWWRRMKMNLRRRVIGPRRKVTKRMARFQSRRRMSSPEVQAHPQMPHDDIKGMNPDQEEHASKSGLKKRS